MYFFMLGFRYMCVKWLYSGFFWACSLFETFFSLLLKFNNITVYRMFLLFVPQLNHLHYSRIPHPPLLVTGAGLAKHLNSSLPLGSLSLVLVSEEDWKQGCGTNNAYSFFFTIHRLPPARFPHHFFDCLPYPRAWSRLALGTSSSQIMLALGKSLFALWFSWQAPCLISCPLGKRRMKSCLPKKRAYLALATRWHFFFEPCGVHQKSVMSLLTAVLLFNYMIAL